MRVGVIVPTLGRPHRVAPLADDIAAASDGHDVTVHFVAEAHDAATIQAVSEHPTANLIVNRRTANYAGAINTAVADTDEPWLFAGADDLHFHPGWLDALEPLLDDWEVLGTNDLANPEVLAGQHATHYLISRSYARHAVIDQPGLMMHEGYTHNWVDRELVGTAKHRNVFVPVLDSVVEHLHWCWGKAGMDGTYAKGRDSELDDRKLYASRQHLWGGL
jgi:hypothetical protein